MIENKKLKLTLTFFAISLLLLLSACSVRYTNFSYKVRGCVEGDVPSETLTGSNLNLNYTYNYSAVSFEKDKNVIKIYFREVSPCKFYSIDVGNLTKGDYVLEEYHIKYEDVNFFELANKKTISIKQ